MLSYPCLKKHQNFIFLLLAIFYNNLYAVDKIHIKIDGVEGELLANIKSYLSLEQQKDHPRLSANRIKRLHQQAPEEIKQALQPFGYYKVNITTADLKALTSGAENRTEPTEWRAHYIIELGDPLILQTVEVSIHGVGKDDDKFQNLLTHFPIKPGDILNHPKYEKGKRLLYNLAEERGYFDARLTQHEIRIDEQAYQAQIVLSFDTGPRYRFGRVLFKQDFFEESLLQRFLTFKEGDFYSGKALLTFKNALVDSDYFDTVEVDMLRAEATEEKEIPIEVTLELRKASKYSFGIGYGTDTGARGSLGWEKRHLNRYGHYLRTELQFSEIRSSAAARYFIPLGQTKDNYLTLAAIYRDETTDIRSSEIFSVGISKNHLRTLFQNINLHELVGIEYRDERYQIGSDSGHAKILMPNITWSYVRADNRIYTLNGYKLQLEMRGALESLGSNVSFLQTHLGGIVIRKLHARGRIIARGDIGYSEVALVNGEFNNLPPSIRFFAGGDRSVRGYDYETLGPRNAEGHVVGGKHLLVGSLEYEHRVLEKWSIAAFIDVGNAFNGFSGSLKRGTGLGVRWHSPVGLIRVDVATALSEEKHPVRLHVTIGPDL